MPDPNVPEKKFTAGEAMIVAGKALQSAGEKYDDDDKLDTGEIIELVKETVMNVIAEMND